MFLTEIDWLISLAGSMRRDVLALISAAIALGVSVHVLERKRDPGAAIAWIGLAWLSPVFGALLYVLFGINRVRRRARRLRAVRRRPRGRAAARGTEIGHHLGALERAARHLTGRPAEPGCALEPLANGDAAYPPMLAAIAGARDSVALSTYLIRDDAGGGPFVDALIAAHRRGVAVLVLLDGIGSGYFVSPAYRRLRRHGVPVWRFMHSALPWRMPFLNLRTHRKVLVVDGRLAFTGGMNLAAENLLARTPREQVRDLHFRVTGPVVAQLTAAFLEDWVFAGGAEPDDAAWFPKLDAAGTAVARVVTSGPDQDLEKIEFVVMQALACARQSIQVVSPYFLPDERLVTALTLAAMRGVAVDIVMPERSNHRVVDWAAHANAGPLLAQGCRIWLSPPPFDHAKIMVVDGAWSLIGSSNFDMRSFRLNFELCMEVYDDTLAAALRAAAAGRRGRKLTERDLAARKLPIRLRDAAARLMLPYL